MFKRGDVVRLKSGGPEMTVMDENRTMYFDDAGHFRYGTFPDGMLEPADDNPFEYWYAFSQGVLATTFTIALLFVWWIVTR